MKKQARHSSTMLTLFSLALLVGLFFTSCKKEEIFSTASILETVGELDPPPTYQNEQPSEDTSQLIKADGEGDYWACQQIEVELSQNADEFIMYSSNAAEIIYPGNLLQGKHVLAGNPRIIPLKRGPGTISINTLNGTGQQVSIEEVSFSNINSAINEAIRNNSGQLTAQLSYNQKEVRSQEEIGVAMNVNFSNLTTDVQGSFGFKSEVEYNRVYVKLVQKFYDIVYDVPTDLSSIFDPSVSAEQVEQYVYEGNPATYVSSVSYGRIFHLLIQSTSSTQAIESALKVAMENPVQSGSGEISQDHFEQLENLSITGYALGGDAELAANAVMGSFDQVNNFIRKGASIETGFPISYVVRSLNDPSIVVVSNLTTNYTISECENISKGLPKFTNSRQCVGAATYTVGNNLVTNSPGQMFLFDCNSSEMVVADVEQGISGPFPLSSWGIDGSHPFSSIGAALHFRQDSDNNKTYFFNAAGTKFVGYSVRNKSFGAVVDLDTWGQDGSCPFTAVGAAMDVSIGTREIACLFDLAGTSYTLFESGNFSPPRSISDLQIRNQDQPVAIPFGSVGAALRLDVPDRVVMAIFNGSGNKYVYFDMEDNVVLGPLDI